MENQTNMQKNKVFNLIIIDESGSMSTIKNQALGGCNETLNTIRYAATTATNSEHLVSIYAFQGGAGVPSRYIIKNADPTTIGDLTDRMYRPIGNTPLFDAIGSTLTELRAISETHPGSTGIVTIITDGEENSSRMYSLRQVRDIITELTEMGWTINFLGANIDVDAMADKLNIHNSMSWESTGSGTKEMFSKLKHQYESRMSDIDCENASAEDPVHITRKNKSFFKR